MNRIEVVERNLIMVHGISVDYDHYHFDVIGELESNPQFDNNLLAEIWNGGKTGSVISITIPVFLPRRWFYLREGRMLLDEQNLGQAVPAEIAAFREGEICQELYKLGIWWVSALGKDNQGVYTARVVCQSCNSRYRNLCLGWPGYDWEGYGAIAGSPQIDEFS